MLKNTAYWAIAASLACFPALAATHAPKVVPTLAGTYVYSGTEICPMGGGKLHQVSGTIFFDPATGIAKLDIYAVVGDNPAIKRIRKVQAYYNDATSLNLNNVSYQIAYGAIQNSFAVYASFIGLVTDNGTCGYQGTLTLR